MSKPEDGGPAFPYAFQHEDDQRFISGGFAPGMTLRDWLAGQALIGLLSGDYPGKVWPEGGAITEAFEVADAMIAERAKLKASKTS